MSQTATTRAPAHRAPTAAATGKPGRITSLDAVRGVLLWINVGVISVLAPRPEQLEHAAWIGVHFEDVVFPLFVTLSGCGLAFAYRNAVGWFATVKRSVVLLVVGLIYNMIAESTLDLSNLRWAGPLQIYAVLVLVIGILHLVAKRPVTWICITLGLAAANALFLYLWQQGCPGDVLTPQCNPSGVIDQAWMGTAHMYHHGLYGHDPEGVISIFGALVTCCVGTTAGHLALRHRGSWRVLPWLLGWAVVVAGGALAANEFIPAFKRLWTTPFALGLASISVAALAVGMVLLDLRAPRSWERVRSRVVHPLVALGRNSLLVYFGSHLLMYILLRHGNPTWAEWVQAHVHFLGSSTVAQQLSMVVVMVAAWTLLAMVLHRYKIYLRP